MSDPVFHMSGPEHYRAAEELLEAAAIDPDNPERDQLIAMAQVNADLAQAAATVFAAGLGLGAAAAAETRREWAAAVIRRRG